MLHANFSRPNEGNQGDDLDLENQWLETSWCVLDYEMIKANDWCMVNHEMFQADSPATVVGNQGDDLDPDKRWLETSWCLHDHPMAENSMFNEFETPEQISILAASYFSRELRLYTDASVNLKLIDDVFKLFMDMVSYCRDIFMDYLSHIFHALSKVPDRSHSRPLHGPAVRLLTELLKVCFDSVGRVVLILDLLRTFSHFDHNLVTMVTYNTTAAVMGSMSMYLDVREIQQFSLDILAKMATYKPALDKKAPLREAGVELVTRAIKHHGKNLDLARSACRMVANLSSTLMAVLNTWLDHDSLQDTVVSVAIEKYFALLEYVFKEGIPMVQETLKEFKSDLGVSTEGRKFIYYYAKLTQLQMKKTRWLEMQDKARADGGADEITITAESDADWSDERNKPIPQPPLSGKILEPEPQGILKKVRSFENLRNGNRRIEFADDTVGGSDSETDSEEDSDDEDSDDSFSASDNDERHPPFHSKMTVDMEDEFTHHVAETLMRKTFKRRKNLRADRTAPGYYSSSESDSDNDLKEKINEILSRSIEIEQQAENGPTHRNVVKADVYKTGTTEVVNNVGKEKQEAETVIPSKTIPKDLYDKITEANRNLDIEIDAEMKLISVASADETKAIIDETEVPNASCDQAEADHTETTITEHFKSTDAEERIADGGDENDNDDDNGNEVCDTAEVPVCGKSVSVSSKHSPGATKDGVFIGRLVKAQIISYVGTLVFKGDDTEVLLVIDRPIKTLLTEAMAPSFLVDFAGAQYGDKMTLMDLEPGIVISVIDAVRYKSLTKSLVQNAVLELTRTISSDLDQSTVNCVMLYFKNLFAEPNLQSIVTDPEFLQEFRTCFQNATARLDRRHSIEDIHQNFLSQQQNFAV